MHIMTDKSEDTSEPPSPGADHKAHLHVVKPNEEPKPKDSTLAGFIKSLVGVKEEASLHDALKELAPEDVSDEPLSEEERSLISNILALRGLRAVDVMIPRADIVAIDKSISTLELFGLLAEKQYSRFPVYKDTLDDVIGTLHIKDVLGALSRNEPIDIESLARDAPIVSPAMHVLDLILEMKQTRRHMALVVDEFGGIDGLVTVGDIIGAIVGEIEDEHKSDDQPQMIVNNDGTIIADGRVDIADFEEQFGTVLEESERQDIDTLGGLVFAIAGRVPSRGEVVSHDSGLVFEILDADPRRVHRVRIKSISKEDSAE